MESSVQQPQQQENLYPVQQQQKLWQYWENNTAKRLP